MARIKVASPISGIRGTLGGIVFSQNGSGTYARGWARPGLQRRPLQSFERGLWSNMGVGWRSLSSAQRAGWNTYGAAVAQEKMDPFGDAYYANGWNWFVTINTHLVRMGRSPIAAAPTGATPAIPTITSFTPRVGPTPETGLVWPSGQFATVDLVVQIARAGTDGMLERTSRMWEVYVEQTPGGTGVDFQDEMEDVYGDIEADQRYTAWVFAQSTEGRRSAPYGISTTV